MALAAYPFPAPQRHGPEPWPHSSLGAHQQGTRGLDQVIGEPDMLDRGPGACLIRAFTAGLLAGAPRAPAGPDANNGRAIRTYENAGFRRRDMVSTPAGAAILMVRDA